MKITLLVSYFPPEIGSAADLFYILSKEFKKKGLAVEVITTKPRIYNLASNAPELYKTESTAKKLKLWVLEQRDGINVCRVRFLPVVYPRSAKNPTFRSLEHLFQPFLFLTTIRRIKSSNVLLVYSPPLMLGYLYSIIGRILRVPTVLNVQDIHPQAVIDLGLTKNKAEIAVLEYMETAMYNLANEVVVMSEGNRRLVIQHGAPEESTNVILNACEIPPVKVLNEGQYFRKKHGIGDKFVVTYAGIMSFSQDLATIVEVAKLLEAEKQICFVMAGEGPEKENLERLAKKLGTENVLFLPFQQGDSYWQLIGASNVCLVSLKASKVTTPVVPRKLHDIMAANRPVIANVPPGDIQGIIESAKCGYYTEPENPQNLADAIKRVFTLPKDELINLGNNGRAFALQNFSVEAAASKYEKIFAELQKCP